jgi:hypothetical protein
MKMIALEITNKNEELIQAINDIHRRLIGAYKKITIVEYIRWCRTTVSL